MQNNYTNTHDNNPENNNNDNNNITSHENTTDNNQQQNVGDVTQNRRNNINHEDGRITENSLTDTTTTDGRNIQSGGYVGPTATSFVIQLQLRTINRHASNNNNNNNANNYTSTDTNTNNNNNNNNHNNNNDNNGVDSAGSVGSMDTENTGPETSELPLFVYFQFPFPIPVSMIREMLSGNRFDNLLNTLFQQHQPQGPPPASQKAVEDCPIITISSDMETTDNNNKYQPTTQDLCPVCQDRFNYGDQAMILPCQHYYHRDCIKPWLNEHNTCPTCRYEFVTDDPDYEKRRQNSTSRPL